VSEAVVDDGLVEAVPHEVSGVDDATHGELVLHSASE